MGSKGVTIQYTRTGLLLSKVHTQTEVDGFFQEVYSDPPSDVPTFSLYWFTLLWLLPNCEWMFKLSLLTFLTLCWGTRAPALFLCCGSK